MKPTVAVRIVEFHESVVKRQGLLIDSDNEKDRQPGHFDQLFEFHTSLARLNI